MRVLEDITEQCNQRIPESELAHKCKVCKEIKKRGDFDKSISNGRVSSCKICISAGHETQCQICGIWKLHSELVKKKIIEGVFRLVCDMCSGRYDVYCSRKNSKRKGVKQWIASLPRKFVSLKRSAPKRKEKQNGS